MVILQDMVCYHVVCQLLLVAVLPTLALTQVQGDLLHQQAALPSLDLDIANGMPIFPSFYFCFIWGGTSSWFPWGKESR